LGERSEFLGLVLARLGCRLLAVGLASQPGDAAYRLRRDAGHLGVGGYRCVDCRVRDPGMGMVGPRPAEGATVTATSANRRKIWIPAAVLALAAAGQCGVAYAMFTDSVTAGPGSF